MSTEEFPVEAVVDTDPEVTPDAEVDEETLAGVAGGVEGRTRRHFPITSVGMLVRDPNG